MLPVNADMKRNTEIQIKILAMKVRFGQKRLGGRFWANGRGFKEHTKDFQARHRRAGQPEGKWANKKEGGCYSELLEKYGFRVVPIAAAGTRWSVAMGMELSWEKVEKQIATCLDYLYVTQLSPIIISSLWIVVRVQQ